MTATVRTCAFSAFPINGVGDTVSGSRTARSCHLLPRTSKAKWCRACGRFRMQGGLFDFSGSRKNPSISLNILLHKMYPTMMMHYSEAISEFEPIWSLFTYGST